MFVTKATQRYERSDLPITHGEDICSLLLVTCFENIEIKGEIAHNEQFHLLLENCQLNFAQMVISSVC